MSIWAVTGESAIDDLAAEVECELRRNLLACWFPRCIDAENGGFHESFARDWTPAPASARSLVFQARMVWVLATVARRRPDLAPDYALWADQGLRALFREHWDAQYGGLCLHPAAFEEKHSYGTAFAVLAAAACARGVDGGGAAELAMQAFDWWDGHARDAAHGGYVEAVARDGSPVSGAVGARDLLNVPCGLRSANTHIHAVEALTELYRATLDERVRLRLETALLRLEAAVTRHAGHLYTTYTPAWVPVDRSTSFGHDVEAVFLVLDARQALGWEARSPLERLLHRILAQGLDTRRGGVYAGRRRLRPWKKTRKFDWVQAEALNTFMFIHEISGWRDSVYLRAFCNVWHFVVNHLTDPVHGGWFGVLDAAGNVVDERKGHPWKACYHPVRALLNASDALTRLARTGPG